MIDDKYVFNEETQRIIDEAIRKFLLSDSQRLKLDAFLKRQKELFSSSSFVVEQSPEPADPKAAARARSKADLQAKRKQLMKRRKA